MYHKLIYFSVWAASQYKNFKNSIDLFHNDKDFEVKAEWNFLWHPLKQVAVVKDFTQ